MSLRLQIILVAILFFYITSTLFGAENILRRHDVAEGIQQIKHDAFGPLHIETLLEIYPSGVVFVGGTGIDVQPPPAAPDLIAIVHCHPDADYPKPSPQDIATAIDLHVTIYTISRHAIWITVSDGTSKEIK